MKTILFFCYLKSCNKPIWSDQDYAVANVEGKQHHFHLACWFEFRVGEFSKGGRSEKKS